MAGKAQAAAPAAEFTGFGKGAQAFYRGIEANNSTEWFEEHRDDYMTHVIGPAKAFVEAAGSRLKKLSPGLHYSPEHTGRGSIKRIHTDQRFIKNRPPFKTYLEMLFWEGPQGAKKENSGFYFRYEPTRLLVVAGIKEFNREVLKAYREAVSDPATAAELAKVLAALDKVPGIAVLGQNMKAMPRGISVDHKHADLLRYDALYAVHAAPLPKEAASAALVDYCLQYWKPMVPLHRFIVDKVLTRL